MKKILPILLISFACESSSTEQVTTSQIAGAGASSRVADVRDLSVFDPNNDGILDTQGTVVSGDIIVRHKDHVTQVEEGEYLVPNNTTYVDGDGDGVLDGTPIYARIVIVMRDNLTYFFAPNSSEVLGVFPNGIGKGGANTVVSVRRINVILGAQWGLDESTRHGYGRYPDGTMPNYFGDYTLGTRFYIHSDPTTDIDTFQEVHGTFRAHAGSVDGYGLLGTDISGGCTRHTNEAIGYMRRNVGLGDVVITMESAQDDEIDNPLSIYNRTMLAARLPHVAVPFTMQDLNAPEFVRPANFQPVAVNLSAITTSTWVNFDQVPQPSSYPIAEHPYTTARYDLTPCGSETMLISAIANGRSLLEETGGRYRLRLPASVRLPEGADMPVSNFYTPRDVSLEEASQLDDHFSGGDPLFAVFEFLVSDLSYQYAVFVAQRDAWTPLSTTHDIEVAVANLSDRQLREVQLVTGLMPVTSRSSTNGPDGVAGDHLAAMTQRTLIHSFMNLFQDGEAESYELDPFVAPGAEAFAIKDMNIYFPSVDHEMVRTGAPAVSTETLVRDAINAQRPIIFRISRYRALTTIISFNTGTSAGHYFALIPEASDLSRGYVAIEDGMHPYDLLLVPFSELADVFTTMTVAPLY